MLARKEVETWGRSRTRYLNSVDKSRPFSWMDAVITTGRLRRARHFLKEEHATEYLLRDVPDGYSGRFFVVHVPVSRYPFDVEIAA